VLTVTAPNRAGDEIFVAILRMNFAAPFRDSEKIVRRAVAKGE
jgi:hypothetical protein